MNTVFAASQAEFDNEDQDPIHVPPTPVVDGAYEQYSERLVDSYEHSLREVVKTALDLKDMPCDGWVAKRKALADFQYKDFLCEMVLMLLTGNSLVLLHFIRGDLAEQERKNLFLSSTLRNLKKINNTADRALIYVQYLVDKHEISPTPAEILEALGVAEEYVNSAGKGLAKSDQAAAKIDSAVGNARGASSTRRYVFKDSQVATFCEFVEYTRRRMESLPQDKPLQRPLAEVGYATETYNRLRDHQRHSSSNYLMNLMEAIFISRDTPYKMAQFVVFECIHPSHAMFAEILYSRMALCYIKQGGGFSHFPAGRSHRGAKHMAPEYWAKAQEVYNSPQFTVNLEDEVRKTMEATAIYKGILASIKQQKIIEDKLRKTINEFLSDEHMPMALDRLPATKHDKALDAFLNYDVNS